MLSPATKKWEDKSTTERFKFVFFCDHCGKAIPSPEYKFDGGFGFKPKIFMSESERRAREIVWCNDRAAALERARPQ